MSKMVFVGFALTVAFLAMALTATAAVYPPDYVRVGDTMSAAWTSCHQQDEGAHEGQPVEGRGSKNQMSRGEPL